MSRLYGEKESIDCEKVKDFFDNRASKEVENILSITMYQDSDVVEKRHKDESKIVLEKLDVTNKKILEIGCGIGRWAEVFEDKCDSYLGIDYFKNLIEIANKTYDYDNCYFQEMSATDLKIDELKLSPPFDIILIIGVLIYLNDEDIKQMMEEINKVSDENTIVYVRETISYMDTRLTLKDFYSEDLDEEYNAIYRTENELLEYFNCLKNNNEIISSKIHDETNPHKETGYKYFIIK